MEMEGDAATGRQPSPGLVVPLTMHRRVLDHLIKREGADLPAEGGGRLR